jgi:hypothetical protein
MKQMKHFKQTLATYVYNHCNICNICTYLCNTCIYLCERTLQVHL